MKRLELWLLVVTVIVLAGGCAPKRPVARATTQPFFGATLSLPEIVDRINANNAKIETLWCRFSYQAWIRDPETKKDTYLSELDNGTIQYRAPGEFRLRATKTGAGLVMDLGVNKENFWLIAPEPGPDAMWWGELARAKRIDPRVPIPPQAMLEVLGITTLNTDLLAEPAPVVRFNPDLKLYMLVWVSQDGDRYVATREVWYDMKTMLPVKVLMFDRDGRALIRADLKKHVRVEKDVANSPRIASEYELFFPETRSTMNIELTSIAYRFRDAPDDRSFRFTKIPVSREIRIDE